MGKFELEMFDPPPDQEFICSICRCVMEDPQECPCGHVFCKECIQQWLRSHSNCPNCRKQCYQVKPVLPMVRNLINHLTIRCENHEAGCDKKVQLEYYDNHKKVCDYASVPCPNEGCDLHVLRINMDKHNSVCDFHRDTCVKGCGISILRKEQKGHSCILELKKKLEEQEQEKRSLKQKNEELQAKVDNLKFLCWRSRNYLKKNVHPEAPRTVHNLCIDLENATGLAPDNTEGHRDAAIPQAAPVQRDEGESSHEGIPLPAMDMPQGTPSSYQPSPDSSPLRAIDFPEGTPSSYQPSPDSSPLRAIDFPDGTPSSYQPSPESSPLRAIDFPDGTPSSYQPSPDRDAGSSPSQYQPSPAREVHTSMFVWSSPSQYQPSPDRDVGSSPSQYQPSPDRVEEGGEGNGDTVEDNDEAVEGGQAQPPVEPRNSTEETEQHNQGRDSTQANSNADNGSRDDESAVESDSIMSDSEVELSNHTANLRYLVSSDSDPTWDEDSPNISDSEGEESDTDNSMPEDDIRLSMNVAQRAEGTVLVEESEEMGDDEDGSTAETIESDVLGHLSDVEQGRTQQGTSQEGFSRSQRPNRNRSAGDLVRVRGTPLVVRNSRNRQRGQRSQGSRASQRQGQGNTRGRGASRPRQGSARSVCSFTTQTVAQARSRHSNTTPPVITIGSSDGNQSPNQRADTRASRTHREGGASRQQRGSVQRTQRNQSASRDVVEINIHGAEEVTARESRRRRGARALRRVAAAQGRSAAAQRRDATAQRRRPTAARSTRRSGASSRPLDSGESDSESVPVAPKRPRRHKGGRN
ncbi:RNF151 [Branchiostoma lanceolatum]|uniref:RNF151 protein n=1 Tax=Branchiostoma lanceolatum TaxID=7740 RepID=A0A8K0AF91_BRALA|nr:RNF151 [Branchiostoma lanceolatum]